MCAFMLLSLALSVFSQTTKSFKMMGIDREFSISNENVVFEVVNKEKDGRVYIVIKMENIEAFRHAFKEANAKYKEWKRIASQNKIDDLDRMINTLSMFPCVSIMYENKSDEALKLCYEIIPYVNFQKDSKVLCLLRGEKVEAYKIENHEFIGKNIYPIFGFRTEQEANDFEKLISEESITKAIETEKRNDELFK